ncbi:MAG: flavodoxin family protein [Eubacterium sp.]|nr:flavodoxin family protein [Eubacterium sp.]
MKVVLINGSARNNGSCSFVLNKMKDAFEANQADVIKYDISDMNISYCKGCKKCYQDGVCIQNDDIERIVKDILSSDYVVIATPSYWADVPGQLKTFFDRNTPFGDTNENRVLTADKEIKGIGIAVRAGNSEKENEVILDFIDHYYGHLGISPIKRFSVRNADKLEDLMKQNEVINEIYDFALQIKN